MSATASRSTPRALASAIATGLCALGMAPAAQAGVTPVDTILACRSITEAERRLACLDEASAELAQAVSSNELVVVDRRTAAAAERDSFGLSFMNPGRILSAVSGRDLAETAGNQTYEDGVEAIRDDRGEIDILRGLPVRHVRHDPHNRLVVTLENGQVWRQTDSRRVPLPREGTPVTLEISRGAMSSFFMRLSHNSYRMRARRDD